MTCQAILELKVKPEAVEKTREWFSANLPDTRAFEGCVSILMVQNQEDPTDLMIIEQWDSPEAYQKYIGWRTERGDIKAMGEMVAAEPKVRVFNYFGV